MPLKLLDYGKLNPFGDTIGKPTRLAWPVNAYRVTLPSVSRDGDCLNPFERVILKLLNAAGAMEASALADETRIPLDLVKSVLSRLRDRAFIDEHNAIIERKRDNCETEKENPPVFVTGLLFRELGTGRILPFLHILDDGNPLRQREEERFIQLIRTNRNDVLPPPEARDVIVALREMRKRSVAFGKGDNLPLIQQIEIIQQPELHHLECPIAIQKSDGEFRIADPFGSGVSRILESAFNQLLEKDDKLAEWFGDWKKSLSNPRPAKADDLDAKPKQPFENEANWQRYPKLVANLHTSKNAPFRSIRKIHASLEWAFFYACCRRSFEDAITNLKFTSQPEHSVLLGNAAQRVGLEVSEFNFSPITPKRLSDFQNGEANLGTVLAIAILQAEKDELHPLRRIAFSHPDLVSRLLVIKKKRDYGQHGKGRVDTSEADLPDDPFMREIIHLLMPEISFVDTPVDGPDKDGRADSLLDARASIQSEFGFTVFNRLGANLQDRLIQAERFWQPLKDEDEKGVCDALEFACDLYAALQAVLERHLAGKLPPDVNDSELVNEAAKKASAAGLCEALPKCLQTTRISMIRKTLQGTGQTLQACAIAFLLMSDDDTLRAIADSQPSFIGDIANITDIRDHGNDPLLLPKADIKQLRKASYSTIKTLMEV